MIDNVYKSVIKNGLFNAYIFNELYKYGFVKSKSFNLAPNRQDLQNKLMHIVKSSANKVVKDDELGELISGLTFSRNVLDVSLNFITLYTRNSIMDYKLRILVENAELGLQQAFRLSIYSSKVSFIFDDFAYMDRPTAEVTTIDKLNNIVNAVMYIPECIRRIADAVTYVSQIDENYIHSYEDIYAVFKKTGVDARRNPLTASVFSILGWIRINHPDRFVEKCEFDTVEQNAGAMTLLTRYYNYDSYGTDEHMIAICNKIICLGEELGYTITPDTVAV